MSESYRLFTWDWKEQPPLAKILEGAQEIVGCGGRFYFAEPDTGGDYYAYVISSEPLSPEQIERILENGR